ncbi:MAG: hypothetical protein LBP55_05235 [Candidatus Adiutrix sp.]|jgi:hypothetical protein|nr:hypothetical protein [Candidatus Adiutrix sp.]
MSVADPKKDQLREALILVFLAVLIAASKVTMRLPLKMPGHGMLLIIFLLSLGRALTGRAWAGLFMGCAAGAISLVLGGGFKSFSIFASYSLVGLLFDLLFMVSNPFVKRRWWLLIIWGALAPIPRGLPGWLRELLAGTDLWVIVTMNGAKVLPGLIFGAIGAALSWPLIQALSRRGYVQEMGDKARA